MWTKGTKLPHNALLDNYSQETFVREDIHTLETSGPRTKKTVMGHGFPWFPIAKILEKYVQSSFSVNFQARWLIADNFTNTYTPSQVFFNTILSPPCSPHALTQAPLTPIKFWRASPSSPPPSPHVLNMVYCGKPWGLI